MIIKSFFHKKTTRVYVIITILFALTISLSFNYKNYYKYVINENFKGTYFSMSKDEYEQYYDKIIKDYELSKVMKVNSIKSDKSDMQVEFFIDDSLKDGEVGVTKYFIDDNNDYSNMYLSLINYDLKRIYDYELDYRIFAINEKTFNDLNVEFSSIYVFGLGDWSKIREFGDYCEEKYDITFSFASNSKAESSYNFIKYIKILEIIPIILGFIYIILFIVMTINIIFEDKNKNNMYSTIGFSKKVIIKNNIIKILIMIGILFITLTIFHFLLGIFI